MGSNVSNFKQDLNSRPTSKLKLRSNSELSPPSNKHQISNLNPNSQANSPSESTATMIHIINQNCPPTTNARRHTNVRDSYLQVAFKDPMIKEESSLDFSLTPRHLQNFSKPNRNIATTFVRPAKVGQLVKKGTIEVGGVEYARQKSHHKILKELLKSTSEQSYVDAGQGSSLVPIVKSKTAQDCETSQDNLSRSKLAQFEINTSGILGKSTESNIYDLKYDNTATIGLVCKQVDTLNRKSLTSCQIYPQYNSKFDKLPAASENLQITLKPVESNVPQEAAAISKTNDTSERELINTRLLELKTSSLNFERNEFQLKRIESKRGVDGCGLRNVEVVPSALKDAQKKPLESLESCQKTESTAKSPSTELNSTPEQQSPSSNETTFTSEIRKVHNKLTSGQDVVDAQQKASRAETKVTGTSPTTSPLKNYLRNPLHPKRSPLRMPPKNTKLKTASEIRHNRASTSTRSKNQSLPNRNLEKACTLCGAKRGSSCQIQNTKGQASNWVCSLCGTDRYVPLAPYPGNSSTNGFRKQYPGFITLNKSFQNLNEQNGNSKSILNSREIASPRSRNDAGLNPRNNFSSSLNERNKTLKKLSVDVNGNTKIINTEDEPGRRLKTIEESRKSPMEDAALKALVSTQTSAAPKEMRTVDSSSTVSSINSGTVKPYKEVLEMFERGTKKKGTCFKRYFLRKPTEKCFLKPASHFDKRLDNCAVGTTAQEPDKRVEEEKNNHEHAKDNVVKRNIYRRRRDWDSC